MLWWRDRPLEAGAPLGQCLYIGKGADLAASLETCVDKPAKDET